MKKRVLSIFMAVALLLTLLPTTALAYRESDSLGYKLFSGWNTRHTQMIAETNTTILKGTVVKIGNTTLTQDNATSTIAAAKASGISITPPAGYYVAEVIIACNDNGGYKCNTAAASNLITFGATNYESATFNITPAELNQGAAAGKTVWHDGMGKPYWIMVRIVKSPDPVHVIYDAGDMKSVIGESTVLVTGGNDIAVDNSAGTASHAVLDMKDDYQTVTSGGKTYRFTGWKVEYYTTYQNGKLSVFNSNAGTVQPSERIKLHLHAKLTAQWEEVTTYHVYYNANGGTGTMTDTKEYATGDAIMVKENAFTYDHKHFVKFTLDAASTQEIPADFKMGEKDITLYAQWEDDPTYRVYYNANGGTGTMTDAKEYYTGDAIAVKANEFTYEHKHFVKFTLDAAGTQEIPANFKMGEKDITLYAQWEDDPTYHVFYDANGGTGTMTDATEYYTGDAIAVKANEFTYEHKHFVKFTLDAAGTQEIPANFKMGEEDITLYAQWEEDPTYRVFYDANGGTGTMTDAKEYYTGDVIAVKANEFTYEHKHFVKFTLDAAGTQEIPANFKMGEEDITLYAQWEEDPTYRVFYDANGGTGTMTDAKEYYTGDVIAVKANEFTYEHKHFVKFTLDAAGTQEIPVDFEMGEEDITLYAQWEDDPTYHVFYDANGGTGTMTDATEYYTGDAITVKANEFTYEHKHFVKFTLDAAGTQEIPVDFEMGEEDITLYAQWEDDPTYHVFYDANGGTGTMTDATEYYTGDAIAVKANEFTYAHKYFVKFTLDVAGTQEIPVDFEMGEEDITLYAQWEDEPSYHVFYDANGGTGTMTDATEYYTGDAIAVKANEFTYAHKYFVKFTLDAAGTQEIPVDFEMGEEDITLYAQWEDEPSYHVFYDANGGTGTMTDATEYYTDDPIIVLKNVFTREGYTFVKFTLDAEGKEEIPDGFKMGQVDITLYAQWEKVKEETPEVPVSGESSHVGMYLCVMLAAAAGAVWMLVLKRKFQQQ